MPRDFLWDVDRNYGQTTKMTSECSHNPEQEAPVIFTTGEEKEGYYQILKLTLRDKRCNTRQEEPPSTKAMPTYL